MFTHRSFPTYENLMNKTFYSQKGHYGTDPLAASVEGSLQMRGGGCHGLQTHREGVTRLKSEPSHGGILFKEKVWGLGL